MHGVPDQLCHNTTYRYENRTVTECIRARNQECEQCQSLDRTQHILPIHYCVNLGMLGYQGLSSVSLCTMEFNEFSSNQLQNNVSKFGLYMVISASTHKETPYFTVVFVGNNLGSWIDILAEGSKASNFTAKSHAFTILNQPKMALNRIVQNQAYLLCIHSNLSDPDDEIHFNFNLHSELPSSQVYDISSVDWECFITLNVEKPGFSVSMPGVVAGGSFNLIETGKERGHKWPCKEGRCLLFCCLSFPQ